MGSLLVLGTAGCERGQGADTVAPEGGAIEAEPLPDRERSTCDAILFQSLGPERTGIDFNHRWPSHLREYERWITSEKAGGGVAIGDYTGNGLPDIYLTRPFGGDRLYRNLGDFRFTDATEEAGLGDNTNWSTGATFADVTGNGWLDLYVCTFDGPNRLYVNRGDGTFAERAAEYGVDYAGASIMAAFADYTGDGNLDLYLVTNRLVLPGQPEPNVVRQPDGSYDIHPEQRGRQRRLGARP